MYVIQDLLNLVTDGEDLLVPFENVHPHIRELIIECKSVAIDRKVVSKQNLLQIDYVLLYLHDHLNIGKWDEVAEYQKQAYTSASYVKTLIVLQLNSTFDVARNVDAVKKALQIVDKGFLLGLPLGNNNNLLTNCASLLTKYVNFHHSDANSQRDRKEVNQTSDLPKFPNKKLKIAHFVNDKAHQVDIQSCPSIELFQNEYFSKETPLVIQDCLTTWPARTKWLDINYLLDIGGERTVPIELGSSYSSEDFSQKLMTLREFISTYYNASAGGEIGYLAQHDLLTQIPELVDDIKVPDYCCLSRTSSTHRLSAAEHQDYNHDNDDNGDVEPEINAWLGPKGTVSSLHYDPKDNLLCQVYGAKQIIMFAPSDTQYLYAHDDMPMLSNTSQVDPTNPDLTSFADFNKATMFTCILHGGEMLYIPPKWWHHVTALEKSFSVNFWWQ